MAAPFTITTPIYYVNGLPHIGHAYTTIAADSLVRWHRMLGREAFFLTGTDEHGQKVLEKARSRGMTPQAHCDDMVVAWKATFERLRIAPDRFFRTTDADHVDVVRASLQQLFDQGEIVPRDYEGWYYIPDEVFVTDKDVEEGKYDRSKLVRLVEKNWFFLMSAYQQRLLDHIEANPSFIRPESRRNEVLGFLRNELGDLCISRPKARMSWGIGIPFDEEYVTYVWFDALLNYLTGLGWHPDPTKAKAGWEARWAECVHLLGKDILTTHAVYWSTMLMALGVPLPKGIYAHGWWTAADGSKMSKSLGNTIDVGVLADAYGVDATRYFFLREIAFGADGGFTYAGFNVRYNADLANDLGNLLHRATSMTTNWLGGRVPEYATVNEADAALHDAARVAVREVAAALDDLQLHAGLARILALVGAGNLYIERQTPWALNKAKDPRVATVLRTILEISLVAAAVLSAVMPDKATEVYGRLGVTRAQAEAHLRALLAGGDGVLAGLIPGAPIVVGDPLFPRFTELPPSIATLLGDAPAPAPEQPARSPEKTVSEPVTPATPATPAAPAAPVEKTLATFDDFKKLEFRVGQILAAEKHPNADRLLVLKVDLGEAAPRTIVAGIASKFAPEALVGRKVVCVANLAPAKLRGVVSEGMLLAAGGDQLVDLVSVDAAPGTIVR